MAADNPDYLLKELQDARDLAQQLWTQCRQSGSSYRLLCGSLRNLRNVLEELEELELRPNDVNLESQIDESQELLERINLSFGIHLSLQSNEVDESAVADFKTSLDVLSQNLNATHDSITTGEIPLKLDSGVIPGPAFPSTHRGSTSASAVDSGYEPQPSTRTSSAYSSIAQDNPWKRDGNGFRAPCEDQAEKEVHHVDSVHLQPAPESAINTATTPSLDWRAPFAYPDPMSTNIEQASNMILRDEDTLTLSATASRPAMVSHSSSQYSTDAQVDQPDSEPEAGLNVLPGEDKLEQIRNVQPRQQNPSTFDRPRALSEVISTWSPAATSIDTVPKLHAAKSTESIERVPPRRLYTPRKDATSHLSPLEVAQEFERRNTVSSGASSSVSARPIELSEEPIGSSETFRKDLSIVFENPPDETDEAGPVTTEAVPATLETADHSVTSADEDAVPPPPPPSRKPPSPPKERQIPKIPKRSATYRIVNRAQSDESSSDDERPLSTMNSLSTMRTKSSVGDEEKEATRTNFGQLGDRENAPASPESRNERRPSRDRIPHAQRVLMARAAYTPPTPSGPSGPARSQTSAKSQAFPTKLSTHSLHTRRYSEEASPTLKRPFISALSPRDRPVTAHDGMVSPVEQTTPLKQSLSTSRSLNHIATTHPALRTSAFNQSESSLEDTSSMFEKETAPETGPEVNDLSKAHLKRSYSADAPDVVQGASGDSQSPSDATSHTDLDAEHISHVVHFWNRYAWDQVESHLTGYLEHLLERNSLDRARRVRHLLGVCASFRGLWDKALSFFLAVLRTPIRDILDLDDGDCAAAYWLGDTYALLNRRTEALLAYRIAERSSIFVDSPEATLCDCINAEQEAVQMEISLPAIKSQWAKESLNMTASEPQSILDLRIVSETAANRLFDEPRRIIGLMKANPSDRPTPLDPNKSRTHAFYPASRFSALSKYHRSLITAEEFEPTNPWPMRYDPFLSMANVRQGRLLIHEVDLIAALSSSAAAKIPKAGPMNLGKMESFAAADLNWLIRTLRESLKVFDMDWSEVSSVKGSWFAVRHSFMQGHFATTHYFAISILKHSLRSGYGVEICPEGICSSRIIQSGVEHQKGVHVAETKRVKKLIREYLDTAAKQRSKVK